MQRRREWRRANTTTNQVNELGCAKTTNQVKKNNPVHSLASQSVKSLPTTNQVKKNNTVHQVNERTRMREDGGREPAQYRWIVTDKLIPLSKLFHLYFREALEG